MVVVTTSLSISFQILGGDAESVFKAEIDDRETGYNSGNTTFYPGSSPVFLIFASSNVTYSLSDVESSEGTITELTGGSMPIVGEWLTFSNSVEASFEYPCVPSSSLARVDTRSSNSKPIQYQSHSEIKMILKQPGVGVVKVNYTTRFRAFRLNGAAGDAPVAIFVTGVVE